MQASNIQEDTTYEENIYVWQKDCIRRKSIVDDVQYTVQLGLPQGDWYVGKVGITFKVLEKPAGQDLHLDFRGTKIGRYFVNGEDAMAGGKKVFTGHKVIVPTNLLKVGEVNEIQVLIQNKYRNDSEGLHAFVDKTDNKQYIYTQFEPACAHYVFPCFD